MVLGNSHYCDTCDVCGDRSRVAQKCTKFTRDTAIAAYLDPEDHSSWKPTYTTFINSLLGKQSSLDDRQAVFDSIVFYNYLQVAAGKDAYSTRLYDYNHVRHLHAFYEVLDEHLPNVVISWGSKVWDALPDNWGYGDAQKGIGLAVGEKVFNRYQTYPYKDTKILLIGVHHPCVGYGREFHYQIFSQLIFNSAFI